MLNDELFVRAPDGMQPTPRAQQMAEPIRDALRVLRLALEPETFDPAQSSRGFTLAVNNYAARAVVPTLARKVAEKAPNVTLDIKPVGLINVLDQLDAGGVDVALSRLVDGGERFKCVRITDDDYVALLDRQHSAARETAFSAEILASIPHVVITSSGDDTSFVDAALEQRGLARRIATRVPFLSIVLMLVGSDRLAIVPRRTANDLASAARQSSGAALVAQHDPGIGRGLNLHRQRGGILLLHVPMRRFEPSVLRIRFDIALQHGEEGPGECTDEADGSQCGWGLLRFARRRQSPLRCGARPRSMQHRNRM
jgi:DNA-binding transcriptional LysR family regulator